MKKRAKPAQGGDGDGVVVEEEGGGEEMLVMEVGEGGGVGGGKMRRVLAWPGDGKGGKERVERREDSVARMEEGGSFS